MITKRKMIEGMEEFRDLFSDYKIISKKRFAKERTLLAALFNDKQAMSLASTIQRLDTEPQALGENWRTKQTKYFVKLLTEYAGKYFAEKT